MGAGPVVEIVSVAPVVVEHDIKARLTEVPPVAVRSRLVCFPLAEDALKRARPIDLTPAAGPIRPLAAHRPAHSGRRLRPTRRRAACIRSQRLFVHTQETVTVKRRERLRGPRGALAFGNVGATRQGLGIRQTFELFWVKSGVRLK
eukprot:scaffold193309_cov29-Tisochrysis_lutea.AAC.4